jgi:hypothetical protein
VLVSDNLKPPTQCAKAAKTAGAVLGQMSRVPDQSWSPWPGQSRTRKFLEECSGRATGMALGLQNGDYEERLEELDMQTLDM